MRLTCGDNEIIGFVLLQHAPHCIDVLRSITPVSLGVHIAKNELVLLAFIDACSGSGDLARDESFSAARGFVIEEDSITGINPVGLTVVDDYPEAVNLGHRIRGTWIERGRFGLRYLTHFPVQFTGGGLVETGFNAGLLDRIEKTQCPDGIDFGRILRDFERDLHMTLRSEIVHLVRTRFLQQPVEIARVGQITVMQEQPMIHDLGVVVEMIYPAGVER
jgi:hypothetical protein